MATTPTNKPIPSEDPRDLKFNAGKIDEVVTSDAHYYTDRFGVRRWTIAGIDYTASQAISQFGYITLDSFQDGATLTLPNQVLRDTNTGEYYRWDGAFPKTVTAGSTPASTGGVGIGSWLSVGDATLRSNLVNKSDESLGDALVGVKQPVTGALERTQHQKNADIFTPADFSTESDMLRALISQGKNSAAFNSYFVFTITVGVGGDYPNLMAAIVAAQGMRPLWDSGHGYCEIKLKSGYVLNSQMEFGAGVDLSWIKITSEDTIVYADTSSFSISVRTYYNYKYLFYFRDGAKSPVFQIQIEENRNNSDVCAFIVTRGAHLNFWPGSGARKFYVGIHASFGSHIKAYHSGCAPDAASVAAYMPAGYYVCDFSHSVYSSLQLVNGVICEMVLSKFDYCSSTPTSPVASVNCIYNVYANFQGSSASYCYIGWNVRDGSNVNIRDHKTIHCTYRGLTMIHTAYVDARRHDVEESDIATSGKVLEPAIQKGFYGCALGVRIDGAGCVDVAGNDMRSCGVAINADTGAVVSGKAVDISDCDLGFDCHAGATISFPRLWGTNIKKLMHLQDGCRFNSNICHVYGSTPTTDIRWIDNERSDASFMNAVIEADSGLIADCGSRITIETSTTKVQSIRSFFGSYVAINNTVANREFSDAAAVAQVIISGGSFIAATGYTNADGTPLKLSTARNTLVVGGAIFSTNGVP